MLKVAPRYVGVLDVLMVTEYTYLGLQGEEGVEDSPLFHKVHSVMSMTMGVGADVEEDNDSHGNELCIRDQKTPDLVFLLLLMK